MSYEAFMHLSPANDDGESDAPIVSRFIDDEIYRPLLVEFVSELAGHVSEIRTAVEAGQLAEACRLGHRLKGAAATYGFPELAAAASAIEDLILRANKTGQTVEVPVVAKLVEQVHVITNRIELGTKLRTSITSLQ